MSPANPSIFLLGATGYVGGCFLNQLLSFDGEGTPSKITVLSRSEEKFDLINKLSTNETKVEGLKGTFEDHELLSKTVEDYDIVIEAGDSDNQELVNALLEGMKRRKEAGKEVTRFIHVSGTGTLADDARGEYKTETVYTDTTPNPSAGTTSLNDLPSSAFHRKIDLSIYDADSQGICKSYLIFPGTVWGEGSAGVYDSGLSKKHSSQIPQQAQASLDRKQAGMVGKGLNVWAHVHIEDLASQFEIVYRQALDSANKAHGREGNYLAVAGEYQLLRVTQQIAKTMYNHKWTESEEVTSFTEDELTKYYGAIEKIGGTKYYSGTNSRGVSERVKALGWEPKHVDVEEFYGDYVVKETERVGKEFSKGK